MEATLERPRTGPSEVEVTVSDLVGHQSVHIKKVDASTPVGDLVALSKSRMALPPSVEWQMRDNSSSRLLRHDVTVGDVATEGKADLTLQPDARLG